ncbi:MAG: response regulator [Nitrospinota bacterium]
MENSKNEKILLVEDEEYLLKSLEVFLRNETKYEIFTAGNGKEAIEIINSKDIDLILTDLKMPEIGGIELMEYVRNKSLDIPVITMTAFVSLNSAIEALRLGVYDYLIKPYEFDMVLIAINRAIERIRLTKKANEAEKLSAIAEAVVTLNLEINNLLTGIMGNLELLLDDFPDDKEEVKKAMKIALENSHKIAEVFRKFQEVKKYVTTEYASKQPMLDLNKTSSSK